MRISVQEVAWIERSAVGGSVRAHLVDDAGRTILLRLPAHVIRALGELPPQAPEPRGLHAVESWRLRSVSHGTRVVLTLHTAEGSTASYLLNAWQMDAIATLATQNRPATRSGRIVN